ANNAISTARVRIKFVFKVLSIEASIRLVLFLVEVIGVSIDAAVRLAVRLVVFLTGFKEFSIDASVNFSALSYTEFMNFVVVAMTVPACFAGFRRFCNSLF
ncbi:MAG: hypothetical protein K8953_11200, partial [Proteobacteria bacterium]|nr:hypothetical protein [Pseudomonadota bacterium]